MGVALAPVLLVTQPAALLLLSPFLIHLVLVAGLIDPWLYAGIALPVCLFQCVIGYLLGAHGAPHVKHWIGQLVAGSSTARSMLLWLDRAAPLVLLAIPGPIICAAAGASGVGTRVFYPWMVTAQIAWVGATLAFGLALTRQIAYAQEFAFRHLLPLTALTAGWVVTRYVYRRWRGAKVQRR